MCKVSLVSKKYKMNQFLNFLSLDWYSNLGEMDFTSLTLCFQWLAFNVQYSEVSDQSAHSRGSHKASRAKLLVKK